MALSVIRSLQIKIMLSILCALAFVFTALLGILNVYVDRVNYKDTMFFLDRMLSGEPVCMSDPHSVPLGYNDAVKNSGLNVRTNFIRYILRFDCMNLSGTSFTVTFAADGTVLSWCKPDGSPLHVPYDDTLDTEVFKQCVAGVRSGFYAGLFWKAKETDSGYFVCFIDRAPEMLMARSLWIISGQLFVVALLAGLLLSWGLSVMTVRPLEEELRRRKQFLADAGHELKTPIAITGANIDVLASMYPDNKWVGYVKTENERMSGLVKDMLYLANSDAGRQPYMFAEFDISRGVASVVLPFEGTLYEQQKKLELQLPDVPVLICGDEAKLKQVGTILIDNAAKNSDAGDVIRVSVSATAKYVAIKVYNSGHGIPQQDLKKIFERFYRADTSRNRQTGGSGLGLAIAKTIVEAHGGSLTAASETGKWAEFTALLPLVRQKSHFF